MIKTVVISALLFVITACSSTAPLAKPCGALASNNFTLLSSTTNPCGFEKSINTLKI